MIKRKCSGCATKIDRKFNYCPWCGQALKTVKEQDDFGLLGREDSVSNMQFNNQGKQDLPFGLGKMINSMVKQLERELSNMEGQNPSKMPKGFSVRIQPGMRIEQQNIKQKKTNEIINQIPINEQEQQRRRSLPKRDAQSKVKRLSDKIIYEVEAPGIKNKDDIIITKLEDGFEVKMYTDKACYIKTIPLNVEVEHFFLKKDKVVIELKE